MRTTSTTPGKSGALKRSHIAKQLWNPSDDDEDDDVELASRLNRETTGSEGSWSDSTASSDGASELVHEESGEAEAALDADADLAEFAAWLEAEGEKELAAVDWESDPEQHSRDDIPAQGLNTAVLQRIRRGHGPRSSKFEDLLAPLRLTDSGHAPRFSKRPIKETCESMEKTLRDWNKHVAEVDSDNTGARDNLMDALRSRIIFLDKALINRWSADAHDGTCVKLLNAIHFYRPETLDFKTKEPMDLLVIIIAHLGYVIPDIDDALKFRMLYTLVTERRYSAFVLNARTRRRYEDKIEDARRRGDMVRAAKEEENMAAWISAGLQKNCVIIIEKIRTARRNVWRRVLPELEELCVLQTAQKLVLSDRIRDGKSPSEHLIPRSVWWPERAAARDAADAKLEQLMNEYMDDLETSCKVAVQAIDDMKDVNKTRVLTRALKFAGLDLNNVTEEERDRIVRERMANPGTVVMMTDAVKGVVEIQANAEGTAESAGKMERRLEEIREAMTTVHYEYDALSKLVNSDPHMVLGVEVG